MKKVILMSLLLSVIFPLSSCGSQNITNDKEITCEDIIRVYEEAGYEIFHKETTEQEYNWECYVKCTAPDSNDYIFFNFFETNEEAVSYEEEREWNLLLYFTSCFMGEPSWLITKTYNNIEIEYDQKYLYKPFEELI